MKVLNGHEICNYEGIKSLQKILEMRGISMEKTLYDMMDWAGIEELVYSEASDPHRLLGAHETEHGVLVQAFIPTAEKIQVNWGGKQYEMELADEAGFFAALIPA